jgi:hypothetical protein
MIGNISMVKNASNEDEASNDMLRGSSVVMTVYGMMGLAAGTSGTDIKRKIGSEPAPRNGNGNSIAMSSIGHMGSSGDDLLT